MLYYFDTYRYIVVIKFPYSNFKIPDNYDYPIAWGQKRRFLVPEIKERALYALENNLGSKVRQRASLKFENISPKEIPENTSWDDVLSL